MVWVALIVCVLVGYLVGSVCSAVIVSKIFALPDPRLEGSQNPGATNVLRLAGKKYAVIVLLADLLKGLLPVLLAKLIGANEFIQACTCFAAVFGHMYPVFFDFKGGKGVATTLGGLLALNFILGVMVIATWLIIANFTRYSSFASIVSVIFMPFYSIYIFKGLYVFSPLFFITVFVLFKHRNNITRLIDGTESKIVFRRHGSLKNPEPIEIAEEVTHLDEPAIVTPKKTRAKRAPRRVKKST
ncbi:transmembrane protein (plasmid) [Legionella adelaidensis]|uniref:Glycerol-3-phosphate acyltransferase n=1 Tax=Legionella adelaidensis TaxID=45056 RepID=A0A0W0R2R5_9GAMM|nr:glycerol-3-phosphate 1-O-acyltransferase PlsY [Legionella adelaidensis]KTC65365.1 transmembrane protein [Legionella adelaidensis]VEH84813.1 transmembrane protein [Legionella adelaidensis]